MSFMERARALYQRDDLVRAAFVLAEGIKREPQREDALNWFLQLYVEEIGGPGLEQELIRVLGTQPDGDALIDGIQSELKRRQQLDRLASLGRVQALRLRAEQLDPTSNRRRRRQPQSESDGVGVPGAAAARPARPRLRPQDPALDANRSEPTASDEPDEEPLPIEAATPRRRRRRRRVDTSPQGVLPLDVGSRPPTDSWRGFRGVAGLNGQDEPEPVAPRPAVRRKAPSGRRAARPGSAAGEATEAAERSADEIPTRPDVVASVVRGPRVEDGSMGRRPIQDPAESSVDDQLLALESEGVWHFGDAQADEVVTETAAVVDERPSRRRQHRIRLAGAGQRLQAAGGGLLRVGRRMRRAAGGRRGPLVLGLLLLLSGIGFGYRACTQFVASQLEEADQALALAQGDSLQRAVELYAEYLSDDHTPERERLDFARALLRLEYDQSPGGVEYDLEGAFGVYGGSAVALGHLSEGNIVLARPLGEELTDRHGDHWLAHWTRGRIAAAEQNWERAAEAFEAARSLDESAVLPLVGMLDLALRAGRDDRADGLIEALESASPGHPLVPVARAALALGIDPRQSHTAALPAIALPDPRVRTLDRRTHELIQLARARQALANWQLDQVGRSMASLREQHRRLGVRASLLEALLAARRYRLSEAIAALEQALNAAPEGSPAAVTVRQVASQVFVDLGRPDLALEIVGDGALERVARAELLVEAGREPDALRLLGRLLERQDTAPAASRILVDFHLRRGVPERARLRADGANPGADASYTAARLAADAGNWTDARDHADAALRDRPSDLDCLAIWSRATAELGFAERGVERIDERSARDLLVGRFDEVRLDVLLASGRAPRETLAEFVGLLESTEPTSMIRLEILAHAYFAIGDLEKAREAGERTLAGEPNNRRIHALLGRVNEALGRIADSRRHLETFIELAPDNEPTEWARDLLSRLQET